MAEDLTNIIQDVEHQQLKKERYKKFVSKMIAQVYKHNKIDLVNINLLYSIFAKQPLGTRFAKIQHAGKFNDQHEEGTFI